MAQSMIDLRRVGPPSDAGFQRTLYTADTFALPTTAADAKLCPFLGASGGMIYVSAAVTITWYVARVVTETVKAAYDQSVTAVVQVCPAEGWYAIPVALFGAAHIAPVAGGAADAMLLIKS